MSTTTVMSSNISYRKISNGIVVVHVGAGRHSSKSKPLLKDLINKTLEYGQKLLQNGLSSEDIATKVCCMLEDSQLTNAAFGSELTQDGTVECDAFISNGHNFAGITCVKQAKNPIKLAQALLQRRTESEVDRILGRAPSHLICGPAADKMAQQYSGDDDFCVENDALIAPNAKDRFDRIKKFYTELKTSLSAMETEDQAKDRRQSLGLLTAEVTDTVGVICIDHQGEMTAVSSSGGITYKPPGRIGPAALDGAATYVSHSCNTTIGCCTSGYGEDLIRLDLARECTKLLKTSDNEDDEHADIGLDNVEKLLQELNSDQYRRTATLGSSPLSVGAIVLAKHYQGSKAQLIMAHTTPIMYGGFATVKETMPLMSHKKRGYVAGTEKWISLG